MNISLKKKKKSLIIRFLLAMWMVFIFPKMSEADGVGRQGCWKIPVSSPNGKLCWTVGDIWTEHGGGRGNISSLHFSSEIVSVSQTSRNPEWNRQMDVAEGLKWNQPAMIGAIFSFLMKKAAVCRKAVTRCCETSQFCSGVPASITCNPPLGPPDRCPWQPLLWVWGF